MKTSLDIYQWFKVTDISYILYVARIYSDIYVRFRKVGEALQKWEKIVFGWCMFFAILVLIFGPMLLFSNLNPIAEINPVNNAQIQIGVKLDCTDYYPLYEVTRIQNLSYVSTSTANFSDVPIISSAQTDQFQVI